MPRRLEHAVSFLLAAHLISSALIPAKAMEEGRECREQEYKDRFGSCKPCKQCDAGQEISKECGFGYGEDAWCVPCRSSRFKEDRSLQKCKPCLDCGLINRFQKANCSTTSNAVCGDCLPGYYRKTKLSGFQDMECIPCGNPPPPYEPNCSGRVNLVALPSVVTSPRDMALAAVICSALATVLLALLVLCVIYCKRQLLEKKPTTSLRSQDCPYAGAELSCLDARWLHDFPQRPCCRCELGPEHSCGPVHLIPSPCEESCSLGQSQDIGSFQSQRSLSHRNTTLNEVTSTQLEGHLEADCGGDVGMRGHFEPPEYLGIPQRSSVGRLAGEEESVLKEDSSERSVEWSNAATDALLPKHAPAQEG
ncbi:tumor necrosis factor receptor superfamily member 19 [Nematolebias whitei]|uniref:tumor necrosis factor receptor superfamily member 19 n=1 Tax=Nematolebias whitei TaxID=451745 RepID=UPI0018998A56|nr:tumor necrosis factor receptor superfamily member 19 [Nematolebias whitei]